MTNRVGATLVVAHSGRPQGSPLQKQTRERAIILICAFAAIASGILSAFLSLTSAATVATIAFFILAGFVLPRAWIPIAVAILIPFQFYLPFAGALNLRGATLFVFAAALRLLIERGLSHNWTRWYVWMIPAALFLLAATVSAIGAANRYAAFKGIYDWLPVFAAAFVVGESLCSDTWRRRVVVVLITVGFAEAILGLVQSGFSFASVVDVLRVPFAGIVYQPNLLHERLADLSFNWVLDGRVLPFGTFINDIDYALFLAAIFGLTIPFCFSSRTRRDSAVTGVAAIVILAALLLTLKGSGLIALAGSVVTFLVFYFSCQSLSATIGAVAVLGCVTALAWLFSGAFAQRLLFLVQRETGGIATAGRTAIWFQLLAQLPQQLWFGYGVNNATNLVLPQPTLNGGAFALNLPSPESAYVATMVETGVIGFVALVSFLLVVASRAYHNARRAAPMAIGVLAAIIAIVFGNLTVASLTTDQNGLLLGVLVGIVIASAEQ